MKREWGNVISTRDIRSFTTQHSLFTDIGRTVYEALLLLSLVGILLSVAMSDFLDSVNTAREVALKSELTNVRTAIRLYHMLNKRYPASLKCMVEEDYVLSFQEAPVLKRTYLEHISTDEEGNILDPFGSLFIYNRSNGKVQSSTSEYESW